MKKTALYEVHNSLGAKLVPFAGFWMPVQYQGIIAEHKRVRNTVGIFDVSHMGEFEFSGADAEQFLNRITINDVTKLQPGQVQYSAMCYEDGGIVDDLLVYRFEDHFILVVNASNIDKNREWICENLPLSGVDFDDISDDIALLSVQGPKSLEMLKTVTTPDLESLPYYHFLDGQVTGINAIVSRTGYTGELGYEIYISRSNSEELWHNLFEVGKPFDVEPIGLGARDTLRQEMKFCLYGNDIDAAINPIEAGLGWITKLKKGDFIGRDALIKVKNEGVKRKLIGFETSGRIIPRHGYPIYAGGREIGITTSGCHSPMLERGIGMGYVPVALSEPGIKLQLNVRKTEHPMCVVKTPFYSPTKT
ncbi:glycine cleavage system protein T [candidate division LCP-89 bacterium B3_LCP]|uniref:Aminomethyltransferase n=1 Tax=candidate division LCP-89 bacterium B3_LCP TaxID=2012998 RepID=A0A532UZV6_UNCL8|nr:MAG: glycine cleavage system protein T [candidate division LCP-89 bacterium B3_LCP]